MINRLLTLALALSLLFNVFFAAGYVRARREAELSRTSVQPVDARATTADEETLRVVRELNLNETQAAAFTALRDGYEEEQQIYRQQAELVRDELNDALAQPQPDVERIDTLLTERAELGRQRRLAASQRFSAFLGMLDPEQRERATELFRRHDGRRDRGRDARKFDTNDDGQLDATERAAMDAAREAQHRERRARMIERFDANGDGDLDEAERAEAGRLYRSERGGGDWSRGEFLKRFDTNGDGILDEAERAAIPDTVRSRRRGRSGDGPPSDGRRRPRPGGPDGPPPG